MSNFSGIYNLTSNSILIVTEVLGVWFCLLAVVFDRNVNILQNYSSELVVLKSCEPRNTD